MTGGVVAGGLSAVSRAACFVAGTEVLMGNGSSKPIEHIVVGDEVTAADLATGETVKKPVLGTYIHEDVETWTVQTSAGTVTSTAEHPFYVVDKGWTPVRELAADDQLVDEQNQTVKVVAATPTGETADVYNFHVENLNNYHVQTQQRAWVRVHNDCGSALSRASEAAFSAAENPAAIFVKNKHLASAGGNGAKFISDDISQIQDVISRGLQSDGVQFLPNQLDDTFRAIVPGGGTIGTRGQESIRVVVTGDGRVISAFPVNVW